MSRPPARPKPLQLGDTTGTIPEEEEVVHYEDLFVHRAGGAASGEKFLLSMVRRNPAVCHELGLRPGASDGECMEALQSQKDIAKVLQSAGVEPRAAKAAADSLPTQHKAAKARSNMRSMFRRPSEASKMSRNAGQCLILCALAFVAGGIALEVTSTMGWNMGRCQLQMFYNESCYQGGECAFTVIVQDTSTKNVMMMNRWRIPTELDTATGKVRYADDQFRCCNGVGEAFGAASSCCDLYDAQADSYCDNWYHRADEEDVPCPTGAWQCLFTTFATDYGEEAVDTLIVFTPAPKWLLLTPGIVLFALGVCTWIQFKPIRMVFGCLFRCAVGCGNILNKLSNPYKHAEDKGRGYSRQLLAVSRGIFGGLAESAATGVVTAVTDARLAAKSKLKDKTAQELKREAERRKQEEDDEWDSSSDEDEERGRRAYSKNRKVNDALSIRVADDEDEFMDSYGPEEGSSAQNSKNPSVQGSRPHTASSRPGTAASRPMSAASFASGQKGGTTMLPGQLSAAAQEPSSASKDLSKALSKDPLKTTPSQSKDLSRPSKELSQREASKASGELPKPALKAAPEKAEDDPEEDEEAHPAFAKGDFSAFATMAMGQVQPIIEPQQQKRRGRRGANASPTSARSGGPSSSNLRRAATSSPTAVEDLARVPYASPASSRRTGGRGRKASPTRSEATSGRRRTGSPARSGRSGRP